MVNTNMFEFKHPKYYKELRKRNRSFLLRKEECTLGKLGNNLDQVISKQQATASSERAPGPGLKPQASSSKPQATESQASSDKHQASRHKPQASSRKQQAAQS